MIGKQFINGKWEESDSGKTFEVYNPASLETMGKVSASGYNDAEKAISSAASALDNWSIKTGKERAVILRKAKEIMILEKESLASLMVREQGKSIHEARNEIDYSISFVEWFAEEAKRIYGDIVPSIKQGQRLLTLKQPIGVVAAITPWNFPIAMVIRKVAPAIAAGCTVVLKPSEETPFCAFELASIFQKADLPDGVLNVVCGDPESIGNAFTDSSKVRLLSFTGSTRVGKLLMEKCSKTVKKVTLELGGNAPFIVFEDADLDKAVAGLTASKLRNGGQSCICANRVYVHVDVIDSFVNKLKKAFSNIKVGDGLDGSNNLGAMINKSAVEKIANLIANAQSHNAEVIYSGDGVIPGNGCFVQPTILVNRNTNADIHHTEIFGPIVSITPFKNEEEVIKIANDTEYGLASYFYTEDRNRIWRVAERLEYGLVGVNDVALSSEMASFGGVKESGIGREGGRHGISEFLEDKFIVMS